MANHLNLADLSASCPLLTAAAGQYMADAATVCLAEEGHGSEVTLRVTGQFRATYLLRRPEITDQMRTTYEHEEATEFDACGIALLLLRDLTGLTVQRAFRGGGFDYWLGSVDPQRPFQNLARLEVSGIRRGNHRQIATRMRQKLQQAHRSGGVLAVYAVVVEFSNPVARIEKR